MNDDHPTHLNGTKAAAVATNGAATDIHHKSKSKQPKRASLDAMIDEYVAVLTADHAAMAGVRTDYVRRAIVFGTRLIKIKKQAGHGAWLEILARLPVGERTAQQHMRISKVFGPILAENPQAAANLPPHLAGLDLLSGLPHGELRKALKRGKVTVDMSVADIRRLPFMTAGRAPDILHALYELAVKHPDPRTLLEYNGHVLHSSTAMRHHGDIWKLCDWLNELVLLCAAARHKGSKIIATDGFLRGFVTQTTGRDSKQLSRQASEEYWLEVDKRRIGIRGRILAQQKAEAANATGATQAEQVKEGKLES